MGMRAPRMCNKCLATATHGKYCEQHKDADAQRERTYRNPEIRKLYKNKRWYVTRRAVLVRDRQCTEIVNGSRCPQLSTDCDHIVRAEDWLSRGGDFYDQDNLTGLCHSHHSAKTAREVGFAGRSKKRCRLRRTASEARGQGTDNKGQRGTDNI